MAYWQPKQTYLHGHIFMSLIEFKKLPGQRLFSSSGLHIWTTKRKFQTDIFPKEAEFTDYKNKQQLLLAYALKAASYGNYWLIHWFQTKALKTSNYWQRQVISLKLSDGFVNRKKYFDETVAFTMEKTWKFGLSFGQNDCKIRIPTINIGGLCLFLFYSAEI